MLQAEENLQSTEIVHLRKNENPPSDVQRITVTRDSLGVDTSEGAIVEHEGGATFYVPHHASAEQFDAVTAKARGLASRVGLSRIYVQD